MPDSEHTYVEKTEGFPVVCRPYKCPSPFEGSSWGGLSCGGGSPGLSNCSNAKGVDCESREERGGEEQECMGE